MKEDCKPDTVVFNIKDQKYHAHLLPYASSVGAPQITPPNISSWKNTQVQAVNHEFKAQYNALKAQYKEMMDTYAFNAKVYGAKFSFEPIVGETYYLYLGKDRKEFLSIIPPAQCNFKHQATCSLGPDKIWIKRD